MLIIRQCKLQVLNLQVIANTTAYCLMAIACIACRLVLLTGTSGYFFFSPPDVGGLAIESRMLVSASIFFIL